MIKLYILQIFNYWYIKYKQNSIIVALKDTVYGPDFQHFTPAAVVWTTFPVHPCRPSHIPLVCAHAALWGSCSARVAPTEAARLTVQKFLHRNGQVWEERFSFTPHPRDPHNDNGLDIRIDCAPTDSSRSGLYFFFLFFFLFLGR